MTIDIVKRLRQEIAGYIDGPIEAAETTMREAADEIERLNTMMSQWLAEDTKQFYGLHASIRENHEIIKILCDHIEYLGYFIDEEFQSNEPNYKYAHFVEVVNQIRDWSKDLKKDLA